MCPGLFLGAISGNGPPSSVEPIHCNAMDLVIVSVASLNKGEVASEVFSLRLQKRSA